MKDVYQFCSSYKRGESAYKDFLLDTRGAIAKKFREEHGSSTGLGAEERLTFFRISSACSIQWRPLVTKVSLGSYWPLSWRCHSFRASSYLFCLMHRMFPILARGSPR